MVTGFRRLKYFPKKEAREQDIDNTVEATLLSRHAIQDSTKNDTIFNDAM